ncbi:hypothetical protein [Streptomyces sp. NPDC058424]|uniref:hypothetical protein n=1 Tax=Streptomyces sp. NPDC058424 TaxID=3346491 RepID=UPI0036641B32
MFVPGTDLAEDEVGQELLRRISSGHRLEVWRLRMPVHTDLAGVPHATGTVERLLVASGRLTTRPTDSPRLLGAGDLLAFGGDAPIYRTDAESADGREHSSTGHARPAYYDYPGRAYQFRHRELQEWVTAHPEPVPPKLGDSRADH